MRFLCLIRFVCTSNVLQCEKKLDNTFSNLLFIPLETYTNNNMKYLFIPDYILIIIIQHKYSTHELQVYTQLHIHMLYLTRKGKVPYQMARTIVQTLQMNGNNCHIIFLS